MTMRLLLLFALLAAPCEAAITVVSSAKSSSVAANATTTGTFDSTGATVLIAAFSWYDAGVVPVLSDSEGQSSGNWELGDTQWDPAHTIMIRLACLYLGAGDTSATHTVTASGTGSYIGLGVLAVAGADDMCSDPQEDDHGGNSGATFVFDSITPSEDDTIVIAAFGQISGSDPGITDPGGAFTPISAGYLDYGSGTNASMAMYYSIQTTATATGAVTIDGLGFGGEGAIGSFRKDDGMDPPAAGPSRGGMLRLGVGE